MKLLKFLFVSFVFITNSSYFSILNAQELAPNFLFLFGQIDVPSNVTITHTLTAQGTYWENENGEYIISSNTEWEVASASITGSTTTNPSYGCTGSDWPGFYFSWRPPTCLTLDYIAYGLYTVTNSYNNHYFYIDIRDCKYAGGATSPCIYYNPDFFVRFEYDDNLFKWRRFSEWQLISKGEVLRVWDIANNGTAPTTSSFEDFWENALVLTNNGNNRPLLVWGPYPDSFVLFYLVYRDENGMGDFTHIATVNNSTFSYTDNSVVMDQPGQTIYYKVKAFGKEFTNTVSTTVIPFKIGSDKSSLDHTFSLNQNYPNPFNPRTTISYSIGRDGLVSVKVFDVLGNEVVTLVDEYKLEGNHEVKFSAKDIPSGIYFYNLKAGGQTFTKKLLLLK